MTKGLGAACSLTMSAAVAAAPAYAQTPPATPTQQRSDVDSALAAARQTGERIKIADATTERSEFYATPDGKITGIIAARDVRFRRNGAWLPLDLTLQRSAGGSVVPASHPNALRLSGARDARSGDFVSMGTGANRITMGWKGVLPEPKLDGGKATYTDVLPGVDLVVQATATGFEQFTVVKSAAAAKHVAQISLPMDGPGVGSVNEDKQGRMRIVGSDGRQLAKIPTPMMWDARSAIRGGPPKRRQVTVDVVNASEGMPGGQIVTPASTILKLTPDQKWLSSPETVYPVTIDPHIDWSTTATSTTVVEGYPTDWPDADSLFVGTYDNTWSARSFVTWWATSLRGMHIDSATAHFANPYSTSCEPAPWEVWTTGPISGDISWDDQPAWLHMEAASTETTCNDGWVTADVAGFFQRAATGNVSTPTMGIRAADENDHSQYKQFWSHNYVDSSKAPYVEVTYTDTGAGSFPMTSHHTLDEGSACITGANRPAADTATPTLRVQVDSPQGAEVRARFELTRLDGAVIQTTTSSGQPSGTTLNTKISSGMLTDGQTYRWHARGIDAGGEGPWGPWCEFAVNDDVVIVGPEEVNEPAPEGLRDALGVYDQLAEANPDDFGYPQVESGKIVVDVVTTEGAQKAEALEQGTLEKDDSHTSDQDPSNKAEEAAIDGQEIVVGIDMDTQITTGSRTHVEQTLTQVHEAVANDPVLQSAGVWRTEVDKETDRIAVTMTEVTATAAARLNALFGSQVQLVKEANPENVESVGRLDDKTPFYGGARVLAPKGTCTSAFAWNINYTSGPAMLTAGHCVFDGGSVDSFSATSIGKVTSGSRENYSSSGSTYLTGQSVYRGDMALVQVNSDKSASARIYRGNSSSTTSAAVKEMWHRRAQSGDKFCTGGSFSGEVCGWTVDKASTNVKLKDGNWMRNVVTSRNKQGWCVRTGDSGGPVYTVRSDGGVAAKGIINFAGGGGSDYYGGTLDPCSMGFTDIYEAYIGFPGKLKTQ